MFLCRILPAAYYHASGAKSLHLGMTDYHMSIINSATVTLNFGTSVVMDRLWPSEHCYGKILRPNVETLYDYQRIWENLAPLKPTYIFCGDHQNLLRHANDVDADHPYTNEQFLQICAEYKTLALAVKKTSDFSGNIVEYSILENGANLQAFAHDKLSIP